MAGRISYLGGIVKNGLVLDLDAAKRDSYDGIGTSWRDISGNQNNGTLTSSPTFNSNNGGYLVFNGSTQYYSLSSPPSSIINWYSGNYTLLCWIYATAFSISSNGGSPLCGNLTINTTAEYWSFGPINTGKVRMYFYSGVINTFDSISTLSTNTWYYLTLSKVSNTISIYINGVLDRSTTLSVTPQSSNSSPFTIAAGANSSKFNGRVSLLNIYNVGLSASEVLQNFNATRGRFGL